MIVYVATPPLASSPSVQTGTPPAVLSAHPVVDTKVKPSGAVSVTVTFAAYDGPALVTVISNVLKLADREPSLTLRLIFDTTPTSAFDGVHGLEEVWRLMRVCNDRRNRE